MSDNMTKDKRSYTMSHIGSRGNLSTEGNLVSLMRQNKIIGWRRHVKIYGNPDFMFRKQRVLVFVDGCFWHGCPKCYQEPKSNIEYWRNKISGNRKRDKLISKVLQKKGWKVIRIWEHSFKRPKNIINKIQKALNNN